MPLYHHHTSPSTSEINPCDSKPCRHNATCKKIEGTLNYVCECSELYTGAKCETGIITDVCELYYGCIELYIISSLFRDH